MADGPYSAAPGPKRFFALHEQLFARAPNRAADENHDRIEKQGNDEYDFETDQAIADHEKDWMRLFVHMLDPEHEYNFADEDAVDLMQRVHEVRTRTGFAIEAPAIHEDQSCEQIMADAEGYAAAGELYAVEQVWMQYIAHELDVRGEEAESAARELHDEATARMKGGSPVVWPPDIRPESPAREKPEDLSVAAKAFGYRSEDAGLRGYWNFANTLGEGGYGRAGLWVQNDRHWNVIDASVVKEVYLKTIKRWSNPFHMQDFAGEKVPKEAVLHREVSWLPQAHNGIVQYRSYAVYKFKRVFGLFMEHCPHGDLRQTLTNTGNSSIPEVVLWSIFETVAAAACLMHRGILPGKEKAAGWRGVIHMDIKPGNVFLAQPESERWPHIPSAKLGDFGLAWSLGDTCLQNPEQLTGRGTTGYMAPEQINNYDNPVLNNQYPLTSATDVFSIGKTMHALMELTHFEYDGTDIAFDDTETEHYRLSADSAQRYSPKLVDLVQRCIELYPEARITAEDLWSEVQ